MRLLYRDEHGNFCFTENHHKAPGPYAVLSHTWISKDGELTYQDIKQKSGQQKPGYAKLEFLAQQAKSDGYQYFWIDTCCIDKINDAEIKAAIRAMFRWYQNSAVCYVYLEDVSSKKRERDGTESWKDTFRNCRWFKRGWTLQELIGPTSIKFFARGDLIGTREDLSEMIEQISGIPRDIFHSGGRTYKDVRIQSRLQWIKGRETTELEDLVYCQMGICDVTMEPCYGEGEHAAQLRFKKEIREYHGTSAFEPVGGSQLVEPISSEPNDNFRSTMTSQTSQQSLPESRLDRLKFNVMDNRRKNIGEAIGETCSWFLDDPNYKLWTSPSSLRDHHGFMWIQGKPGAGKSVLMKFLETHTRRKKKRKDICIAFYFNARGMKLEKSLTGMYRSIIVKLHDAVPDLRSILENALSDSDDESEGYLEELKRVIRQATSALQDRKLTIFVDALDECHDGQVQHMIDFFAELCQNDSVDGRDIRVCFASRHYPVVTVPTGLQLTLETAPGHTTDLANYIDLRIKVGTSDQRLSVKTEVLQKSSGVFLWVKLVLDILEDELRNARFHAVRKHLKELPEDLADLFSNIIKRDNKNLDESLLCIRWILYAKRPLSLKEWYFAMMSGLEDQDLVWKDHGDGKITEDQMRTLLTTSSKGLAELTHGDHPTAQFIHESVRDYLVLKDGLKQLQHNRSHEEDHEMLKGCCLKGMEDNAITRLAIANLKASYKKRWPRSQAWKPTHPEAIAARQSLMDQMPFFEYAVTQVLYHADQAQSGILQDKFLQDFAANDMNWRWKFNLVQKVNVDVYNREPDIVYVCAERNLARLIEVLATLGYQHNTFDPDQRFGSPLLAALANKSVDAAKMILKLDNAEDPDAIVYAMLVEAPLKRSSYEKVVKSSPWVWAIDQGCEELAVHLAMKTTDRDIHAASDKDAYTPLQYSVLHNHTRLVERLINREPGLINARNRHIGSKTALMLAVQGSRTNLVETLVRAGADVNLVDCFGSTALQFAALLCDEASLTTLLNAGADIHARDSLGRNALHYAMHGERPGPIWRSIGEPPKADFEGSRAAINILLDRGAMYNKQTLHQGIYTPLHKAVSLNYLDIAEKLIYQKLDVNLLDSAGRTAIQCLPYYLFSATVNWSDQLGKRYTSCSETCAETKQIVKLLLMAGASPNSILNGPTRCPLIFYALVNHDVHQLRHLLERGADITTRYEDVTVLHFAAMLSDPGYTRLLIGYKANIYALDSGARSPLHVAVMFGHPDVVQVLLEAGAQIHATSYAGQTPSQVALEILASATTTSSRPARDAVQQCLAHLQAAEQRMSRRYMYGI